MITVCVLIAATVDAGGAALVGSAVGVSAVTVDDCGAAVVDSAVGVTAATVEAGGATVVMSALELIAATVEAGGATVEVVVCDEVVMRVVTWLLEVDVGFVGSWVFSQPVKISAADIKAIATTLFI